MTKSDRTPIRRTALWLHDRSDREALHRVLCRERDLVLMAIDDPAIPDGCLLLSPDPYMRKIRLNETTAYALIKAEHRGRGQAWMRQIRWKADEDGTLGTIVGFSALNRTPKEAAVAGDIEVKRFTRHRVEYWIPTGSCDVDGTLVAVVDLAHAWAVQELVTAGVIKEGSTAEGHVRIKPSDEHVIVYIEFDEEQGK